MHAYLSLGCSTVLGGLRQDALLEAGGAEGAAGSRGSQVVLSDGRRLDVGGSRWGDELSLLPAHGPADLPAVGGLIAGLTWDVGGLRPWAGILSCGISPRTPGWLHPSPWPVLLPGERETDQYAGAFIGGLMLKLQIFCFKTQPEE